MFHFASNLDSSYFGRAWRGSAYALRFDYKMSVLYIIELAHDPHYMHKTSENDTKCPATQLHYLGSSDLFLDLLLLSLKLMRIYTCTC